jgi:hypothetical protein
MTFDARTAAGAALVAGYGVIAAVSATLYGALHGHSHGDSTLHAHGSGGTATAGHVHPDAALLVAASGLGIVALTWLLLPADRRRTLPGQLALCSAAAATIHFAVVWPHWSESVVFSVLFAVTGVFQLTWASLVLVRPSGRVLWAGAVVSVGVAFAWGLSRTVGLPIGPEPWTPEAVGLADVAATVFELAIAAGSLLLLSSAARPIERRGAKLAAQVPAIAIGVTLLVALTLL